MFIQVLRFCILVLLGLEAVTLYKIIEGVSITSESNVCKIIGIQNQCPSLVLSIQVGSDAYSKTIETNTCLNDIKKYTEDPQVRCYISSGYIYFESDIHIMDYGVIFGVLFVMAMVMIIIYRISIRNYPDSDSDLEGDPDISGPLTPGSLDYYGIVHIFPQEVIDDHFELTAIMSPRPKNTVPDLPPRYSSINPQATYKKPPPAVPKPDNPPSYSEFKRNARMFPSS